MDVPSLLSRLLARQDLTAPEARVLFDALMDGRLEPPALAALLTALAAKGECVEELVGAAEALRARAVAVRLPPGVPAIDTCGTGGDGRPILNVSTCAAIVAAAAGATVAKHGNRSNTRPSGSAEVLAALGVNIEAGVPVLERCLERCGIAFLYAPRLHPTMRHVAPVRKLLGIRTIFNLLGPLANPAGVRRQLVGVSRPDLVAPMLAALRHLGAERAMVVHGRDGLSDLTIAGSSLVGRWDGRTTDFVEVSPGEADCVCGSTADLCVSAPAESAARVRSVLNGEPGPGLEIVTLNTAAALWVSGLVETLASGGRRARAAIESGAALRKLDEWIAISHN
ncbi:MAG: anthranilate phosphoribosyltransferase [Planctomycetota bacterium]